ncbi:MAG TPA: EpsI family protein [Candidatus Methylacidiphilales bacterium]
MFRFSETYRRQWLIPLLSAAVLFGFLLLFFPFNSGDTAQRSPLGLALWAMWTTSDDTQDFTYCFLVPVIVAFILFEKRRQLARIPASGSTLAILALLIGLVLFWLGARAGKQYLGCVGIQVLIAGVIFWYWGRAMFRPLLFAWIFITFAWPLPFIDSSIAFPMRLIVSHLANDTLNTIGIPTVQQGTALLSMADPKTDLLQGARFQIDVADPCSGLRSLLPLLMFSACFAYFFLPWQWQRWTVFLSAFPLVIFGNVVRILLLVRGCIQWGPAFAFGTDQNPSLYHEGCGLVVFVVVLGAECLLGFFLLTLQPRLPRRPAATAPSPAAAPAVAAPIQHRPSSSIETSGATPVPFWRSGVILGLVLIMMITWWITPPLYLPAEAGVLMSLPDYVTVPNLTGGEFLGTEASISEPEHTLLPKDTEFCRKNYDDFHGHHVFFSIVLSGLQQYTIHPPQVCLVAQGWTITKEEDFPVRLASGRQLVVRNLSIERPGTSEDPLHRRITAYYMYWYVADGITTPSHATRNLVSAWDRIFHNRDHRWAYVIASSVITQPLRTGGLDGEQTKKLLADFIAQIVPTFQKSELTDQSQVDVLGQK